MPPSKKKKAGPPTHHQAAAHAPAPEPEEEEGELSVEERLEIIESDFAALKAKLTEHGIFF